MKGQEKIINNENWFIVEILLKCEPINKNENQEMRRVSIWGNHHLIKADSASEAFEKANKLGKREEFKFTNHYKIEMEWIFIGIGELLPIYEDIEDGAEIMWTDYGMISNKNAMKKPYKKEELLELIKPKKASL